MVEERIEDGKRIAQLLASEVDGREDGVLDRLTVIDANREVEGSVHGERAYRIARDGEPVATVYVHEDRTRIEFRVGIDAAADAALDAGLRTRPKAVDPPRTLVFVESGAAVKRAVDVIQTAVA